MEQAAEDNDNACLSRVLVWPPAEHSGDCTWIMNMIMGFLESYLLGLAPSRIPPCFAAREAAVAAAAALAVTVAVTVESIVLAIPSGYVRGDFSNLWIAHRDRYSGKGNLGGYDKTLQRHWSWGCVRPVLSKMRLYNGQGWPGNASDCGRRGQ